MQPSKCLRWPRSLRSGGTSLTLICGYGRGFSVFEVVDTVKRVSGVDFKVEIAPQRMSDAARILPQPSEPALGTPLPQSSHHCQPHTRRETPVNATVPSTQNSLN